MKIDLSRFRIFEATCSVNRAADSDTIQIRAYLQVQDVETRLPTEVNKLSQLSGEAVRRLPPGFLRQEVRRTILQALEHELDECLFIDGVRLYDPHPIEPGSRVRMPDGKEGTVSAVRTLEASFQAMVGKAWFSASDLVPV